MANNKNNDNNGCWGYVFFAGLILFFLGTRSIMRYSLVGNAEMNKILIGLTIIIFLLMSFRFKVSGGVTFIMSLFIGLLLVPIISFLLLSITDFTNTINQKITYGLLIGNLILMTILSISSIYDDEKNQEGNFIKKVKAKVPVLFREEMIRKVRELLLFDAYIGLFREYYIEDIKNDSMEWYTNEYFEEKSLELREAFELLKNQMFERDRLNKDLFGENLYKNGNIEDLDPFVVSAPYYECYSILRGKTGEDKVKGIFGSLDILYYDSFNLLDESIDESVEIDFITVLEGAIHVFEVKNYSADEIKIDKSGELMRISNNRIYSLDTLQQIGRHNNFIRKVYDTSIDIYNFIVLTDLNTRVINEFDNKYLEVIKPYALEYKIRKNQSEEDKKILLEIAENETKAKKFKMFNIDNVLYKANYLLAENEKLKTKIENLLIDENINKFFSDIEPLIREEIKNTKRYAENKDIEDELVKEISKELSEEYKNLLNKILVSL